ncbi:MAG: NADH-quinone oxidoreductase subunit N, partial [Aquificaceae bacterium]|nr:NADH-quinone oxidoreductase subunit N [Aquificaceae bacterium]MDW8097806.1 NADH-quinone oxidoreductase subunit N [Aquificaceae bacterium]
MEKIVSVELPNLWLLLPEMAVLFTGFLLFTLDLFYRRLNHTLAISVSVVGYLIAFLLLLFNWDLKGETFYGLYHRDGFSTLLQAFMLLFTMALLGFTYAYYRHRRSLYGEFYYILNFALVGGMFLVSSYNLVVLYVALEAVSIAFYIMIALLRSDFNSKEGAFKYLMLGGLSIALASYGAGFMYIYAGSLDLRHILTHTGENQYFLVLGLVLFLLGFAVKIGAVPFHFWLPDAYQGAPTPITAYMASAGKLAFFAPIVRLMPYVQEHFAPAWITTVSVISAVTMLYGNLTALVQKDVKRLLAYSSIAHSGYILAGIAAAEVIGLKAVIYFLLAYSLMGFGSFLVLALMERVPGWENRLEQFSGLRFSVPWLAFSFMVLLLALLGVPPTVGFVGKALVFMALSFEELWWLAFAMIVATGISTGYYLKITALMFMEERREAFVPAPSTGEKVLLLLITAGVVLLGAVPIILWNLVSLSAS